jgi:hypothetical protein
MPSPEKESADDLLRLHGVRIRDSAEPSSCPLAATCLSDSFRGFCPAVAGLSDLLGSVLNLNLNHSPEFRGTVSGILANSATDA